MPDAVSRFYRQYFPETPVTNHMLQVVCPFCKRQHRKNPGTLTILLNEESFFHGYFWCRNRCCEGGFPLYFAKLNGISLDHVPGFDPDREYFGRDIDFPAKNINQDVIDFTEKLTPELINGFQHQAISKAVLEETKIGYNGRYLVYPYIQRDDNYYAARCVHPEKEGDSFWYGNEKFTTNQFHLFNCTEIDRCENGSLVIVEGEKNLLPLKKLGLPCIAVPSAADLVHIDERQLQWLRTIFLWVNNTAESLTAARSFATIIGYKVRLVSWQADHPRKYSLTSLAVDRGKDFQQDVFTMLRKARAFSPFATPDREYYLFNKLLGNDSDPERHTVNTGFPLLDKTFGELRGINIMGGTPKAGKSCLFIQIATEMASRKIPVIYYDFENGKQKIYLRTLSRWSRVSTEVLLKGRLTPEEVARVEKAKKKLKEALRWFRVVNDRQLTPELMRRHIDFLRRETNGDRAVVIIDSLHKLPFKDLTKRRSGIDGWLRHMEAIRDELQVSFLVISELARGQDGQFEHQPQLGSFKGSGDIAYSADNALIFLPEWDPFESTPPEDRINNLWMVASREQSPGKIAAYRLDFPYWGFTEQQG
ncbi:DnaB-like helicase C-terminal domain-containing protein [Desulfogranum marinum]|uniref:DnaB-like helicase C-terminal domain-containing protein n=1 Tax=Desulfogranum marinum TaxID=453220 RepID=UPI001963A8E1|nr:DnaB-like helicase C-terminal domain-containing protein [Desulfogranum marinum]MBM9511368.1 AAA family ATPase [Desulfogranum marinum]